MAPWHANDPDEAAETLCAGSARTRSHQDFVNKRRCIINRVLCRLNVKVGCVAIHADLSDKRALPARCDGIDQRHGAFAVDRGKVARRRRPVHQVPPDGLGVRSGGKRAVRILGLGWECVLFEPVQKFHIIPRPRVQVLCVVAWCVRKGGGGRAVPRTKEREKHDRRYPHYP
jgi:hypothetical protein